MVTTCSFVYESGKTCGRIPRRGETLCRDHRNRLPPRALHDQQAFDQSMSEAADRLAAMPFDQMLDALQLDLIALEPLVDNKASTAELAAYTRATTAVTLAIDRYALEQAAAPAFHVFGRPAVPPLSAEQFRAWGNRLAPGAPHR